ncbi:crAss001_48 related protein [Aeromonas veronii]|uniref:crAss001_48 related protein n=1 Tax=Aeromonas veronii TaxID=654 RepID=UPI003BA1F94D
MEQQNIEPWARAVLAELDYLEGRREVLCHFLAQSLVRDTLPADEIALLEAQHRTMQLYADILRHRLLGSGAEVDAAGDPPAFQDLIVECVAGQLRISVGVKAFSHALATGRYGMRKLSVIDVEVFAKEVAKELTRSLEQGGTLVHRMFDQAAGLAADRFAHWVERSPSPTPHQQTHHDGE